VGGVPIDSQNDGYAGLAMAADLQTAVAERLLGAGQRYSRGRRTLVDVLEGASRPLTIKEILGRDKGLAQSSAYRNLVVLEQAGIVHRVVSTDEFARYELAEHLTEHHHHHLICSQCGQVADFTVPAEMEEALGQVLGTVAEDAQFQVQDHRLDLIGQCRRCA
jgi:Fur family transcriptional regulator, ferric uptake regulator